MASQVVGADSLELLEIHSYVRGYHAYMDVWNPVQGLTLLLKREPTNDRDKNAVAVLLEDRIVGHVPHNLAHYFSQFLRRDFNKGQGSWLRTRGSLCVQALQSQDIC